MELYKSMTNTISNEMKNLSLKFTVRMAIVFSLALFAVLIISSNSANAFSRTVSCKDISTTCDGFSPDPETVCSPATNGTGYGYRTNLVSGDTCNPAISKICEFQLGVAGTKDCSCVPSAWSPAASTICAGQTFTQSDGCGHTQGAVGTYSGGTFAPDPGTVCIGTSFIQTNGCSSRTAVGTKGSWVPSTQRFCSGQTFTQTNSCNVTTRLSVGTDEGFWHPPESLQCLGVTFTQTSTCGLTRTAVGTSAGLWRPDESQVCSGQKFTKKNTCTHATQLTIGTYSGGTFSPDPSAVCQGTSFLQSNSCFTKTAIGTNAALCVQPPTLDLKVNSSNNPPAVTAPANLNVSWTTTNSSQLTGCSGTGQGWDGIKATTGGNDSGGNLNNISAGNYTYSITCNKVGGGTISDSVGITVNPPPNSAPSPSASGSSGLSANQPNYCTAGPAATFNWSFSDPDLGDTQSAYQVQADNNSDFSSPEVDSNKALSTSNAYASGSGKLAYNATYYWRVKVWDNHDLASSWMNGSALATPKHIYPTVNFQAFPANPSVNETVQFTDLTTGGAIINGWNWNIPDATYKSGSNANSQNPTVEFTSTGTKIILLTARDADNYQCSNTDTGSSQQNIRVNLPLPGWKEVAP